jgi:trk system potassium uptake protein TrkA
MKIIICGAGKVGLTIASYLEKYDNDIVLIDRDGDLTREISEKYDIQAITGFASDPDILEKAGAETAEMIIAVTHFDETNITACEVAHALFKVPLKIARIRNSAYLKPQWSELFSEKNICIDAIISPEIEVANAIKRTLAFPGAFRITPLAEDSAVLIGVRCTSNTPIVNTAIRHIHALFPDAEFRIVAIERADGMILPNDNEKLLEGDNIYFITATNRALESLKAFGHHNTSEKRKIILLGGGNVGYSLAQKIESEYKHINLNIIEINPQRAKYLARELDNAIVTQGSALEAEILKEAGVASAEMVIAITEDDKVNTLACLLAKRCGARHALALLNSPSYAPLVTSLGIDSVLNPREITVSSILRHVRRGNIRAAHTLTEDKSEVIEADIHENLSIVGLSVGDIEVPNQMLIGAIYRKEELIIPTPETNIQLDDRIIVVAQTKFIHEVERMLSVRLEYF